MNTSSAQVDDTSSKGRKRKLLTEDNHTNNHLDRTILGILPHPDATASSFLSHNNRKEGGQNPSAGEDGVLVETERLHRLHGTSLIQSSCRMLHLSTSCFGTACTIFHRYCHAVSLKQVDVWSVAMASLLIAAKTQEIVLTLKQVIVAFAHLFRKRRLLYYNDTIAQDDETIAQNGISVKLLVTHARQKRGLAVAAEAEWPWVQKQAFLQDRSLSYLSPMGPVWKEWLEAVTTMEHKILRQLGFTLYWIPQSHPHKFLDRFCAALLGRNENDNTNENHNHNSHRQQVQQRAWNYCNDAFLLDFCIRYPPSYVACAALYLASLAVWLEPSTNRDEGESKTAVVSWLHAMPDWLERLCGAGSGTGIATIANALLGLGGIRHTTATPTVSATPAPHDLDLYWAWYGFVPPLFKDSFNGPFSFVWAYADDVAQRHQPTEATSRS